MITFDEQTHTYTNDIGKKLISVTQLMQKHGLSPSYANVDPDVLQAKAERGSMIHKEIENWLKYDEAGFTDELLWVIRKFESENLEYEHSELMVYNEDVAGTIDLVYRDTSDNLIIADFKTTYQLHKEAVSWQLSIYKYLYELNHPGVHIDRIEAWHLKDKLNVVEIPLKPIEDVIELLECEHYQSRYVPRTLDDHMLEEFISLHQTLDRLEQQKKDLEEFESTLKAALEQEMRDRGMTTFENEGVKLTLVADSVSNTFDSKKFKEDNPDVYKEYLKTTKRKGYLKITLKEQTYE